MQHIFKKLFDGAKVYTLFLRFHIYPLAQKNACTVYAVRRLYVVSVFQCVNKLHVYLHHHLYASLQFLQLSEGIIR